MKSLHKLNTYTEVKNAKAEFEDTEALINIRRSQLRELREKIANTQLSYKQKLADNDTKLEKLEALEADLSRYQEKLSEGSKKLKKLQKQLPQKEQAYNEAKEKFISEAVPEIDSMLEELQSKFEAFVSANNELKGLRSDINTTPLPPKEFPDLPEHRLTSIADVLEYKKKNWNKWAETHA